MSQPTQPSKPTEIAELLFSAAAHHMVHTGSKPELRDISYALEKTAEGLGSLAVGLRATYILLKEVKDLLAYQAAQLARRP